MNLRIVDDVEGWVSGSNSLCLGDLRVNSAVNFGSWGSKKGSVKLSGYGYSWDRFTKLDLLFCAHPLSVIHTAVVERPSLSVLFRPMSRVRRPQRVRREM